MEHWDIASDHVVMTMGLRSGLVTCTTDATRAAIRAGRELTADTISEIRAASKQALKALSARSKIDVDDIDLFLAYGQKSLRQPTPLPNADMVECDLDRAVDAAVKPELVSFMNSLDSSSDSSAKY